MVYVYGTPPPADWSFKTETVSEDYEWQIGEYGGFEVIRQRWNNRVVAPFTDKEAADTFIKEMKEQGNAKILFIRVEHWKRADTGALALWEYKIQCVFKGSPVPAAVIIAILVLLGLIIIVAAPILWKYAGLTPEEVSQYADALAEAVQGVANPLIILAILAVIFIFLWSGGLGLLKKGG